MKKWYKNEKGAMTVYAIVTILSFIFILTAFFLMSTTIRKGQLKTMPKIKEVYEKDLSHKYEIYEAEVEKRRDKVAPTATITLSSQASKVGENITATIELSDNKNRLDFNKCGYVCNESSINVGKTISSYIGGSLTSESNSVTLSFPTPGTYYLHVLVSDMDKNSAEEISGAITVTQ